VTTTELLILLLCWLWLSQQALFQVCQVSQQALFQVCQVSQQALFQLCQVSLFQVCQVSVLCKACDTCLAACVLCDLVPEAAARSAGG
jgi:hypothetical protein